MRRSRTEKIQFIKKELYPLKSYVNENTPEREQYEWVEGDINYYVRKDYFGDDKLLEVYIRILDISNIKRIKTLGETYIYKLPYNKGSVDFVDIEDWTCQVL